MSVRVNKAKNFRNKAYVAADELDNLIESMQFATALTGSPVDAWKVNFTYADQDGNSTKTAVDLTAIKEYIDNKSITVTGGNGIEVITSNASGAGSLLNPQINADIDGTTIVFTGSTEGSKKIATDLKLVKKTTANTGFAATYYLAYGTSTTPIGAEIDIVKDQFLKSGSLVYGTALSGSTLSNESATRVDETYKPYIKLELYTNTDGDLTNEATTTSTIYIPVNDLFDSYEAGNEAINATDLAANKITVVVDGTNTVYTASNTSASILSIGANGIEAANIQGAINYAVTDEHTKASAAISGTNDKLIALGSATSAAVNALNVRISAVATNAQNGIQTVGTAVDTLDTQVSAAVSSLNDKIESGVDDVITNVNAALGTNITAVNTAVSAAISATNTKVNTAVTSVNTQVTALKNVTSTAITTLNANVSSFKNTVSATINSNNTALSTTVTNVNTNVSAVIANVNTVLKPNTSTCAVTLVEETVTPTEGETGVYATTVQAKYVLNVFGSNGDEIYPDIVRGSTLTDGKYTFTLTADYGATQSPSAEQWKVICANDVTSVATPTDVAAPATVNTVAYSDVTNNVAYTNAGSGNDATYGDVTKTDADAVDVDNVTWDDVTDVKATSVGQGTAATVPAVPARTDKAVPNYSGYSA